MNTIADKLNRDYNMFNHSRNKILFAVRTIMCGVIATTIVCAFYTYAPQHHSEMFITSLCLLVVLLMVASIDKIMDKFFTGRCAILSRKTKRRINRFVRRTIGISSKVVENTTEKLCRISWMIYKMAEGGDETLKEIENTIWLFAEIIARPADYKTLQNIKKDLLKLKPVDYEEDLIITVMVNSVDDCLSLNDDYEGPQTIYEKVDHIYQVIHEL